MNKYTYIYFLSKIIKNKDNFCQINNEVLI
jgi:hypothetical protein